MIATVPISIAHPNDGFQLNVRIAVLAALPGNGSCFKPMISMLFGNKRAMQRTNETVTAVSTGKIVVGCATAADKPSMADNKDNAAAGELDLKKTHAIATATKVSSQHSSAQNFDFNR